MNDLTRQLLTIGDISITGTTGVTTTDIPAPLRYTLREAMIMYKDKSDLDIAIEVMNLMDKPLQKPLSDMLETVLAQRQIDYYKNL